MSSTFTGPEGTIFNSSSDLSGDVRIVCPEPGSQGNCLGFDIPGADLIAFVANHVRNERITWLEQAKDDEILKGLGG